MMGLLGVELKHCVRQLVFRPELSAGGDLPPVRYRTYCADYSTLRMVGYPTGGHALRGIIAAPRRSFMR